MKDYSIFSLNDKFLYHVLFDSFYEKGNDPKKTNITFMNLLKLIKDDIDKKLYTEIYNVFDNDLNKDVGLYENKFKLLVFKNHAIGSYCFKENKMYSVIIANTGIGIKYHYNINKNNINYCKPFIKFENLNSYNIEYILSNYYYFSFSNTFYDTFNIDDDRYYISKIYSYYNNIKLLDIYYPSQISGNCSYLSYMLILYYIYNNNKHIYYQIDYLFKYYTADIFYYFLNKKSNNITDISMIKLINFILKKYLDNINSVLDKKIIENIIDKYNIIINKYHILIDKYYDNNKIFYINFLLNKKII